MSFRKGVIPQPQAPSSKPVGSPATQIKAKIITSPTETSPSELVFEGRGRNNQAIRGVIVDTGGKIIRGLSQATIAAHHDHTQTASERCKTCGEMRPPAEMQTVVGNAYNASNPLRICKICAGFSYKDPRDRSQEWRPQMPSVRFDRERANPYDPRTRGVSMKDLVTRDTYHRENEVSAEFKIDSAPNEGQWFGGARTGHQVTQESLERSRAGASSRRR